ncbi:MAG: hypothetical protein QM756_35130 [Polyangiaceae bacterium]
MKGLLALLGALLGVGCGARDRCEEDVAGLGGVELRSLRIAGNTVAVKANDEASWRLRATLSGLPRLWQSDSAILGAGLQLALRVAYESPPLGGDGATEMPRIAAHFDGLAESFGFDKNQTSSFPGPAPESLGFALFQTCNDGESVGCCVYGATECSLPFTMRLERIDDQTFPAVSVEWTATATARVSTCPLNDSSPSLSLALEAP